MLKIQMTPIVEMDGDEMTRVVWRWVKEILIEPNVELATEYYDLGLENRDKTCDEVTAAAARATKRLGVAVKCATITPDDRRMKEYNLKNMWRSPNGTIRRILDGTVFRSPITVDGIAPLVAGWKKPVVIARHAYGDIYSAAELNVCGGSAYLTVCDENGTEVRRAPVHDFGGKCGILQGLYNTDESIYSFARSCFNYALGSKLPVWFGAKDTVSKIYDGKFKRIFAEVYENEYKADFEAAGLSYSYSLIDDIAARVLRSEGGMLWVCKNYDGDVMSDIVAAAFGSLGMMTSVLVSPDGKYEFEAAHGTVTRHYYKFLKGEQTSTNPVATIFAWTGALNKRGELDKNSALCSFAKKLEKAVLATIEKGQMTGDLIPAFKRKGVTPVKLDTRSFLHAVAEKL